MTHMGDQEIGVIYRRVSMYVYVLVKQKPAQPEAEGRGHPCIVIYSNPESTLFFRR